MVINGGDMLPKSSSDLHGPQKLFLDWLEQEHFPSYKEAKIHYCGMLGNDDLAIFDDQFFHIADKNKYFHDISHGSFILRNVFVAGCNWVKDYPFSLKDRCLLDTKSETAKHAQTKTGLLSTVEGYYKMDDWPTRVNRMPRLDETLDLLWNGTGKTKNIYVIHQPPWTLSLDVCANGQRVGSKAVFDFIQKRKPFMTLHGHIHESYKMTGIWETEVDHQDGSCTSAVQPGQSEQSWEVVYVLIDTKDGDSTIQKEHICN